MRQAGLLYGNMPHHLDHVAPFCALKGIPCIVTDESMQEAAEKYYPDLQVIFWNYLEATHEIVRHFDQIFTTLPRPLFDDACLVGQLIQEKKVATTWLPHGNSDKGHLCFLMEGLIHETDALVYGQKMMDFMEQKNVLHHLQSCTAIGNFRLQYYQQHRDFYQKLVDPMIDASKKILLYAPTWRDEEASCSLDAAWPHLVAGVPDHCQLIVKLHPNMANPPQITHPRIIFCHDFPPIYPLLERADVYLGDMSSVGYDFLYFDRPMFFFNTQRRDLAYDQGLYLHRCGKSLLPEDFAKIYDLIEKAGAQKELSAVRKQVYDYTFACKAV